MLLKDYVEGLTKLLNDDPEYGELEVLNLIPNAKRLNIPFDNLLNYKRLSPNIINLYVKNQYNIELAKLYLKEICHDIDIYEKRNNAFAKILQENITEIKIPKDLL